MRNGRQTIKNDNPLTYSNTQPVIDLINNTPDRAGLSPNRVTAPKVLKLNFWGSVRPSVKLVTCEKTEEKSVQIFTIRKKHLA